MRLWSLHPKYLDAPGLVAVWREGLLAQAVLRGRTRGYTRHPQLDRFREHAQPVAAIADYLRAIHDEALLRGYRFDARKIGRARTRIRLAVARGQIDYEWRHLIQKLETRSPLAYERWRSLTRPAPHPSFRVVRGGVASWEKRIERS